jgi:acetyl esterase/lipase
MKKLFLMLSLSSLITVTLISQPRVVRLWPDGVPNSLANQAYKERIVDAWGRKSWASVTDPEVLIYKPEKEKSNGIAIVICPGGAYYRIAFEKEGNDIVPWLNDNGITAIILKYRLPSDSSMKDKTIGALQDAQEAIRLVRRNATSWGINPSKIGVMGFSAGGHLASTLATHFDEKIYNPIDSISARPDFVILGYPVISMLSEITHMGSRTNLLGEKPDSALTIKFSNELQVKTNTPPTFIFHSVDDGAVPLANTFNYFTSLRNNNIVVEMHIYPSGGHGYGLAKNGKSERGWPDACINWLNTNVW